MMYPYMTWGENNNISHSEMLQNGRVKVYIETPDEKDGFHHATCFLPNYEWTEITGYSEKEMEHWRAFVKNNAHLMIEFSQCGGVLSLLENAKPD